MQTQSGVSRWNAVGAAALALLAYSGQLGASPILSWLPVNATALSATVVALTFVLSFFQRHPISPLLAVPAVVWLAFLLPAIQVVSGDYAHEKFVSLMTLGLLCVVAPIHLLRFRIQQVAFLVTLVVSALLAGVVTLSMGDTAAAQAGISSDVLLLSGANTIATARMVGTGAVVLIAAALVTKQSRGLRRAFLLAGMGLAAIMLATGSRGPVAGIVAGIAAVIALAHAMRGRRVWSLIALTVGGVVAYWWASSRGFVSSDRAFAWLAGERDDSTQAREYLWDVALDYTSRNPLGTGWGGFVGVPGVPPALHYPHNLFLELLVEAGWLVGGLAILFVLVSLWRLLRRTTEPVAAIMFGLAVFAFVNAMVSGDINDNRLLWILLGSAWAKTVQPAPYAAISPSATRAAWMPSTVTGTAAGRTTGVAP